MSTDHVRDSACWPDRRGRIACLWCRDAAAAKATGTPTQSDHEAFRARQPMVGTGTPRGVCWRCGFRSVMRDSYGRGVCNRHMGED